MPDTTRGRPPASSRAAIESVAIALFLDEGYDRVTVDAIARAAGVGRTTFFRYFTSKASIVWSEFDAHTARLRAALEADDPDVESLTFLRTQVVETLRADLDADGLSMQRFRLLDTAPELRPVESEHWTSWAASVAEHVARRHHLDAGAPLPAAIGSAVQAVVLATLRDGLTRPVDPERILADLDASLGPICDALQPLLPP